MNIAFKDELKKAALFLTPFSVSVGAEGGYVLGVKRIISFSAECIELQTVGGTVKVKGSRLSIDKLVEGDVAFKGKVNIIEVNGQ